MSRRFLIISSGNEGTDTALMLRNALYAEYGTLEAAPVAIRFLALNTDDPRDGQYPEPVQLKDPEKLPLKVENLQHIVADTVNYHHLTRDLPTAAMLSENTTRGSARIPSQGMLTIRYHHDVFVERLKLIFQQLYDPRVFPDAGELCVILIVSGCTGTGRGTATEILIEVKRQLNESRRRHRLIGYILSPEGLSPEDLKEKQKVFYGLMKELNGLGLGESYQRPFLPAQREQTWTGLPADYLFLVSARSESIHLASLYEVKQAVVCHLLYELTSTVGTRMESARRDCVLHLRGFDGYGQPTFLSLLGLSMIDLPVRTIKQLCLAQGGIDVCRTMLGQVAEQPEPQTLIAAAGLSLPGVSDALGQGKAVSRLSAIFSKIQREFSAVRPNQWGNLISNQGSAQCETLLSRFRDSLSKRQETFIAAKQTQLDNETRAQMTAFGQHGIRSTQAQLRALIKGLGVHDGSDGLIQRLTNQMANASEKQGERREEEIRRRRQTLSEAQRGLFTRVGLAPPTEARDQLMDAVRSYYESELYLIVSQAVLEVYRTLGSFLISLTQQIDAATSLVETVQAEFERQLEVCKAVDDFSFAEYLIRKEEYKTLYDEKVGQAELDSAAQELLTALDTDVLALRNCSVERLMAEMTHLFRRTRRFDFLDHLSFATYFEKKYPEPAAREQAIKRAFGRAAPLTITDTNYARSQNGTAPEVHQFVLVPSESAAQFGELITRTRPIPPDNLIAVPEKRLLILREEHGWPVSAVPYLRNECAVGYKNGDSNVVPYHISNWAAAYPDPIPIQPITTGKPTAHELFLLAVGFGIVSRQEGQMAYTDGPISILLGTHFEEVLEALESDASDAPESDYAALARLTFTRERELIKSGELKAVFGAQARIWSEFARELRDVFHSRYGSET